MADMTPDQARRLLGVGERASAAEIRAAYRVGMRRVHPDLAGGSGARAAALNEARRLLVPRDTSALTATTVAAAAHVMEDDRDEFVIVAPAHAVFDRLVAAVSSVADVTSTDRRAGLIVARLGAPFVHTELRVELGSDEPRTVAFTLHSEGDEMPPPIEDLVRRIAASTRS
jgi:hypothetical protein